jgi:starch synthase (maltosyl-transferring)
MEAPSHSTAPHLYNLFPRLAGDLSTWPAHAARAAAMGFDWLYLNPVHYPGFSGSCYAVKDYWRIDPLLLPADHPDKHYEDGLRGDGGLAALGAALSAIRAHGMRPVMDLVLNHTARDSALVDSHPEWYVRDAQGVVQNPWAIDPADARKVTVWGDLAEIDNEESADRDRLWEHWIRLVETYAQLGFEGFRCDAAYKVPATLWRELIAAARRHRPEALFFGEILGARLTEMEALRDSGLHFVFNSSKWWNFDAPWCLDQQRMLAPGTRSVSFPESHDTPRLWSETGGNLAVQKQRYAFAAAFGSGLMMPVGYEFAFRHRLDVVASRPQDWETPAGNLTAFVTALNAIRRAHPALISEMTSAVNPLDRSTLLLAKQGEAGLAHVAINKDWHASQRLELPAGARGQRVLRVCRDAPAADETAGHVLDLAPAEVAYLV